MTDWHDLDEGMYMENILDHNAHPHNRGPLPDADFRHEEESLSCGDRLALAARLDGDRIAEARFEGSGCALSVAAASMLTDALVGKATKEALAMTDADVFRLLGFEVGISRLRCATLALKTFQQGLSGYLKSHGKATENK